MGTLSKEGLQLVCDSVLIRNALILSRAIEAIEEKGFISEDHGLIEELRQNLQVMQKEIEQRGLKMLEEEDGFLQGVEYAAEPGTPGSIESLDSHIARASARISK